MVGLPFPDGLVFRSAYFAVMRNTSRTSPFGLLVALLILLSGCHPKESVQAIINPEIKLSGQVFVITNDDENHCLGRVEVAIYESEPLEHYWNQQSLDLDALIGKLKENANALDAELTTATAARDKAESYVELINSNPASSDYDEAHNALDKAKKKVDDLTEQKTALWLQIVGFANGHYFFDNLPVSLKAVRTDSDGRYHVSIPKNKSLIVVAATKFREQSNFWIIRVPITSEDNIDVTLSNDNVVDVRNNNPVFP
jgi:hypothetical protein